VDIRLELKKCKMVANNSTDEYDKDLSGDMMAQFYILFKFGDIY